MPEPTSALQAVNQNLLPDKYLEDEARKAIISQALIAGSLLGAIALATALTFGVATPAAIAAFLAIGGSSTAYYSKLGFNSLSQNMDNIAARKDEIKDLDKARLQLQNTDSEDKDYYDIFVDKFYQVKWKIKQEKRELTLSSAIKRAFLHGSGPFLSTVFTTLGFAIAPIPGLGLLLSIAGGFLAARLSMYQQNAENAAVGELKTRLENLKPLRDQLRFGIALELLKSSIQNIPESKLNDHEKEEIIAKIQATLDIIQKQGQTLEIIHKQQQDLKNYLETKKQNNTNLAQFITLWIARLENPLVPSKLDTTELRKKNTEFAKLATKIDNNKKQLCDTTKQQIACVTMGIILGTLTAAAVGAILVSFGAAIVPAMGVAAIILIPSIIISHHLYKKEAFKGINNRINKVNNQFTDHAQETIKTKQRGFFSKIYDRLPGPIKRLKTPQLSTVVIATMLGVIALAVTPIVPLAALGVLAAGAIVIGAIAAACETNIKKKEAELERGDAELKLARYEVHEILTKEAISHTKEAPTVLESSKHLANQHASKSELQTTAFLLTPSPLQQLEPSKDEKTEQTPYYTR